jgi:anaerobic nitric oxide reductase flavorubredoxin
MSITVKNNVKWVGKIDWELRKFHGDEYSTHNGSSYNSYLVKEEKVALLDTVWGPFANEFVANLSREIDLGQIDYVIANHGENDHSGALPLLMQQIPDVPIYCTKNGKKSSSRSISPGLELSSRKNRRQIEPWVKRTHLC